MKMLEKGKSPAEIADLCDLPIELVSKVEEQLQSQALFSQNQEAE